MPSQVLSNVENNFTKGLVTEFTGLNFPENAATDTSNCIYTIVGDVTRREGIDYESNGSLNSLGDRTGKAVSEYKWNTAGGDGLTQIVVTQVGNALNFFRSTSATTSSPLSTTVLVSTVFLPNFLVAGSTQDPSIVECQFSDGNGYLFVFNPYCEPFYCTYSNGTIVANVITVQIRDFAGIPELGVPDNYRPPTNLFNEHKYNLLNQGWLAGAPWSATSTSSVGVGTGPQAYAVQAGLTATVGQSVTVTGPTSIFSPTPVMNGTVSSYSGTNLVLNITSISGTNGIFNSWTIVPVVLGYINTWLSAIGNYPSNADVWWSFKNTSGVFDPATTVGNVSLGTGPAPKGHVILNAFNQQRTAATAVPGLTDVVTTLRPKTGAWFQGRIWYTGVDSSFPAAGDAPFSTWSESIYFSQIIANTNQFGYCYQQNDPTSQTLFGLLPSDGGVIKIQGCGSIYKLFALQNAMLVFAANGVWYITGSAGIGFTANDYTIVKLSSVRSISCTSLVDVQGLPIFWNEEGIYQVEPAKQGTSLLNSPLHVNPLEVNPITVGTILSFYNNIPLQSKKYVRGAYHPIDYVVQWTYRSTNESSVTDRYQFDSILCFNTYNKAFYPYAITGTPKINGILYVEGPGGSSSPDPVFKYFCSQLVNGVYKYTFADEHDGSFVDWKTFDNIGANYNSFFVTGYKLHGQGERRFQMPYIYVYSRLDTPVSYYIQSLWDYAKTRNSGRWSTLQQVNINNPNFGMTFRRHRLRGQGLILQIKISSVDGQPFDVVGWAVYETTNTGV